MSDQKSATTPKSPSRGSSGYKVYRQGFLLKAAARSMRKKLTRYWFVLFQQKDMLAFLYFQDEDHYLERKKNEGFFRIDDATSIDVLPEYMGRKNAFCIATPRNDYTLVSESRYELHHWLFALHNAMEEYKNSTVQRKKKQTRQRTNSTTAGATPNKTPPKIKPSRPAPPAPKGKKKCIDIDSTQIDTKTSPLHDLPSPTTNNLDVIVAGLLAESQDTTALNYTMTEEEENRIECLDEGDVDVVGNLSYSIPTLSENGTGKTVTGDSNSDNVESDESDQPTRHFSLSGSFEDFDDRNTIPMDNQGKKRSKKRGSVKGRRSVSPPNLPPPPPPDITTPQHDEENNMQVMNTTFTEELDQFTSEIIAHEKQSKQPKPPPPVRTTSLPPSKHNETGVKEYIEEAFIKEDIIDSSPDTMRSKTEKKHSPPILRRGNDVSKPLKRTVMFKDETDEDRSSPSYEPRIDQESFQQLLPTSVAEAKAKLFGNKETESVKYTRQNFNQSSTSENIEDDDEEDVSDELIMSIENVLQTTSYMEKKLDEKKEFTTEIAPPKVNLPVRNSEDQVVRYSPMTSPNDGTTLVSKNSPHISSTGWSDIPIHSTKQDTVYRSIV